MTRSSRAGLLLLTLSLIAGQAAAQQAPLKGVVWQEPRDASTAIRELMLMDSLGVEAVRTGIIRHNHVLTLADTLGIQIFQELPIAYLPASGLRDTVGLAMRLLDEYYLARSQGHPSARHFGLARMSDTSDPEACAYFERLTEFVRERGPTGARTYYVTPFVEEDRCADAVDFVLLNALDSASPAASLESWSLAHDTSGAVGIGALGAWVQADGGRGLQGPRSEEAQARYLERQLNVLLRGRLPVRPYAVFVYRWGDTVDERPQGLGGMDPRYQTYGLIARDGQRRPAFDVVRGLYTGRQTVFAFDVGGEPPAPWPWRILLGWGAIALLGGFYAASPRLRFMIPRYFTAHGFYRDAVREGRDVLVASSTALLAVLSVTAGLVFTIFLEQASASPAFSVLLRWLAEPARAFVMTLLAQPWAAFLTFACVYASSAIVWSLILALISRRRYTLAPSQTLMLVVWPRWPLLGLLLAAMVIPTLPPESAFTGALIVVAILFLVTLFTIFRTLYDFATVTRVPGLFVFLAWIASPMMLLILIAAIVLLQRLPEAQFLYHLVAYR